MKWSNLIAGLCMVAAIVFSVLYFVHPRVVQVPSPQVAQPLQADFAAAKPDTVYIVKEIPLGLRPYVQSADSAQVERKDVFASVKTFNKSFLFGNVTSEVTAYASTPVYGLENSITVSPNREAMIKELNSDIERKCRSSFRNGLYLGAGATAAAIAITVIVLR